MSWPHRIVAGLVALGTSGGCGLLGLGFEPSDDEPDYGDPWHEEEDDHEYPPPLTVQLAACTEGLSEIEVEREIAIAFELEPALSGLAWFGERVRSPAYPLVQDAGTLLLEPEDELLPEGWSYEGHGAYVFHGGTDDDSRVEVRIYDGTALVEPNVFTMNSYLLDAKTYPADVGQGYFLTHDGPGPLVEWLGLGPQPAPLLTFDHAWDFDLVEKLGGLRMEAEFSFDAERDGWRLSYQGQIANARAADLTRNLPLRLERIDLDGRGLVRGQDLWSTHWGIFATAAGLDGVVELGVYGQRFDFTVRYEWDHSTKPEHVVISCFP